MSALAKAMSAAAVAFALLGSGYAVGQRFAATPSEQVVEVPLTATVERRVLTDGIPLSGDVLPTGTAFAVADRTSAVPAVVTATPAAAGTMVTPGTVVAEISGRPVLLLSGDVPVYRALDPGAVGIDVRQLEANLSALGLLSAPPDDTLDEETALAVGRLYREGGYEPPADGVLPLGEVAFAPGGRWVLLRSDLQVGQAPTDPLVVVGPGAPALHASADHQRAARIREGMAVRVTTTSGVRDGVIASIRRAADGAGSADAPATVVITTDPELPVGEVGSSGSAEVILEATDEAVIVVPVTALHRDAAGQDTVTVLAEDGTRRVVRVEVGLVAGGAAALRAADPMLEEGVQVLIRG